MLFFAILQSFFLVSDAAYDPKYYRVVVTSNSVFALTKSNFDAKSSSAIIMKYDLAEDSDENNAVETWTGGYDIYLQTPYDYTRPSGPLGM